MAILRSLPLAAVLLTSSVTGQIYLSPDNDINLPASNSATNPLTWLGGNSPYYAGPNVNGVENKVPEGCTVDQVFHISRHGSRYPDSGAYNGWVTFYQKIQAASFTATGDLAFLKDWKPVLTNPTAQIANQSPTGFKEAYDLGYRLRTKYPNLYDAGTPFISWANLYPRVIATARNFVRGFLGETADTLGSVIVVDSRGGSDALFNSLGPADQCPSFADLNGGTYATTWDSIFLPPIVKRLNSLLNGDLVLTDSDVSGIPYLCGFESQITGILSPFCSVFTDDELKNYQYRQDLRYYYGVGPGTDLQSKMMLPFLDGVIDLISKGPGQNGTAADGSSFKIPKILTAFTNDGQMTEFVAGLGVFDDQTPLSGSEIPAVWKYVSSRFCSMRGSVAFERYTCPAGAAPSPTTTAIVTPTKACNRDNCFRQMLQNEDKVKEFCGTYTTAVSTATTALPTFVSQCVNLPSRVSSACTCIATPTPTPAPTTFIRILLNDAVYPLPACQDGPGKTCGVEAYRKLVAKKLADAGDLKSRCNSTLEGAKMGGARFFSDLSGSYLSVVKP